MARELDPNQLEKLKSDPGFIAALDQSGGSTPVRWPITESRRMRGPATKKCSRSCIRCEAAS